VTRGGCQLVRCTKLGEDQAAVPLVAIDPDGRLLATSTSDSTRAGLNPVVRIWDIAGGRVTDVDICHAGAVTRFVCWGPGFLMFSPDGTRLFIEGPLLFGDLPVRVIDVASGTTFTMPSDLFRDAIRAEGSRFAYRAGRVGVASRGDLYALFHGNDIRLVATDAVRLLQGHTMPIAAAVFSPDGTLLATGSLDGTARVWSASTGELVYTSPVGPSDVVEVTFSPDASRVTAVYSDGRVIVYPISLRDTIEIAEARVTRELTAGECRRYLHVANCPADS
jgi:WD40 repeat protein